MNPGTKLHLGQYVKISTFSHNSLPGCIIPKADVQNAEIQIGINPVTPSENRLPEQGLKNVLAAGECQPGLNTYTKDIKPGRAENQTRPQFQTPDVLFGKTRFREIIPPVGCT